jgi:pimeloyl-ACP methyl ester carboxylesterase
MIKTIDFLNDKIRYSDTGAGIPLVLLHGYLESLDIWTGFVEKLPENLRLICPDLPGHGKSATFGGSHGMELLADSVIAVLDHCGADKCFIAGHSMGGYAGLAMLEKYPGRLLGLCLLHSHPFPDTKQVMNNRCREIVLVRQGKKELISRLNIPRAFAPHNLESMKTEVERATAVALTTPDEGIIASLNGMMQRPSREKLLRETALPVLVIAGKHDNYISFENVALKIPLPGNSRFLALENSGHIGFLEEPDKVAEILAGFIRSSFSDLPIH